MAKLLSLLSTWQSTAIAFAVALLIGFGAGWWVCNNSWKADALDDLRASVAAQNKAASAQYKVSQGYQNKLDKLQKQTRQLQDEADDDIKANPGYAACLISDGMQQLINRAAADD